MTSSSNAIPVLPDGEKFDGSGYSGFKTKFIPLAKARGLYGYLDGTIIKPTSAATGPAPLSASLPPETSVYSTTPSLDEWTHRDSMALALIVLNIKDPVGLGVKTDGTAAEAWKSLEDNHSRVNKMGLVLAKRELHTTFLAPGTPIGEHVARLCSLWVKANDMGATILDEEFVSIFIGSLGEEWDAVVPQLYAMKTSTEVISFVTMHADRLSSRLLSSAHTQALAATTNPRDARRNARMNLTCSNPQCGAPNKRGHTIDDCFWPGGGKAGQWPSWWKGKKAGTGTPAANAVDTYAFVTWAIPEAVVNVYDTIGTQTVTFRGEEVLASPESLMAWSEASDATTHVTVSQGIPAANSSIGRISSTSAP